MPPPGTSTISPSEAYWGQLDAHGARQGTVLLFYTNLFEHVRDNGDQI